MTGDSMNIGVFLTIATTGFTVAFLHAAIPTHWLPFVAVARVQKWSHGRKGGLNTCPQRA